MNLTDTLGNKQWMAENADKIKALLPETWTHIQNINGLQLGFGLKRTSLPEPKYASEAYLLSLLMKMTDEVRKGLK